MLVCFSFPKCCYCPEGKGCRLPGPPLPPWCLVAPRCAKGSWWPARRSEHSPWGRCGDPGPEREVTCCPAQAIQTQASSRGPLWPGGCSKRGWYLCSFWEEACLLSTWRPRRASRQRIRPWAKSRWGMWPASAPCLQALMSERPCHGGAAPCLSGGISPPSEALAPVPIPVTGLVPAW